MPPTLRRFGRTEMRSRDWVVAHVDDAAVAARLRGWDSFLFAVPYHQWQLSKASTSNPFGVRLVGYDLYFPAEQEGRLRRELGLERPPAKGSLCVVVAGVGSRGPSTVLNGARQLKIWG